MMNICHYGDGERRPSLLFALIIKARRSNGNEQTEDYFGFS
jgi:hypothetical protein